MKSLKPHRFFYTNTVFLLGFLCYTLFCGRHLLAQQNIDVSIGLKNVKAEFPRFVVTNSDQASGVYYVFGLSPFLSIIDNYGNPGFYFEVPGGIRNFSPQPNGLFSFYGISDKKFYIINEHYQLVDSFEMVHGIKPDFHEFILLEDGGSIMMGIEPVSVDMSLLVPGGQPDATVSGLIIQEFDESKNLVFEWKSLEHIGILDCDTNLVDLTSHVIDYIHGNSIFIDEDNNLIISSRNLNEITKINRTSGEIMWRLGGKKNEFEFLVDGSGFSAQHSAFRLQNSKLVVFDNGVNREPELSRGLIYEFFENERKLRMTHDYRQTPDVFTPVMGSITSPSEERILIGWGKNATNSLLTEFDTSGQVSLSISLDPGSTSWSYKISYIDSLPDIFSLDTDTLDFGVVETGDSLSLEIEVFNNSGYQSVLYDVFLGEGVFKLRTELPIQFSKGESEFLSLVFKPSSPGTYSEPIYFKFRSDSLLPGNHMVSSRVIVEGVSQNSTWIEEDLTNEVLIYPNPFSDQIILEDLSDVEEISLRQLDGKILLNRKNNNHRLVINTEPLVAGFYFIALKFADGHYELKKLVKMN